MQYLSQVHKVLLCLASVWTGQKAGIGVSITFDWAKLQLVETDSSQVMTIIKYIGYYDKYSLCCHYVNNKVWKTNKIIFT